MNTFTYMPTSNTTKAAIGIGALALIAIAFFMFRSQPTQTQPTGANQPIATAPSIPNTNTPSTNTNPTTPTDTDPTPNEPTTSTPNTPNPNISLPVIDETWKTHTNSALEFEFQWPMRGRYAPIWEVTFAKEEPCNNGSNFTNNDITFCHQSTKTENGDTKEFTDFYSTKKGSQYIVMNFTKKTSLKDFDEATYTAHLDQIVSTFRYTQN